MEEITPMKSIRAKSLDWGCGNPVEVRLCTATDCPLHIYRTGHRPQTIQRRAEKKAKKAPRIAPEFSAEPFIEPDSIIKPTPARKKPLQGKYKEIPIDGGRLMKIERVDQPEQIGTNQLQRQADNAQSDRERAAAA